MFLPVEQDKWLSLLVSAISIRILQEQVGAFTLEGSFITFSWAVYSQLSVL